ncbi:MAG: hypothetical protein KJ063_05755 [Anaerolineae bacterium]|nr:hypothetical protein [Anaerolineae bacterium]
MRAKYSLTLTLSPGRGNSPLLPLGEGPGMRDSSLLPLGEGLGMRAGG